MGSRLRAPEGKCPRGLHRHPQQTFSFASFGLNGPPRAGPRSWWGAQGAMRRRCRTAREAPCSGADLWGAPCAARTPPFLSYHGGSKRLGFPKYSPLCLSSVPRTAGGLGGDAGLRATPLCIMRSARPRRGRFCGQQPPAASRGQIVRPVPFPQFPVTPEDASLLLCCCGAVLPASRPEQCSHLCRSASRITGAGICTGGRGFGEIERNQNLLHL